MSCMGMALLKSTLCSRHFLLVWRIARCVFQLQFTSASASLDDSKLRASSFGIIKKKWKSLNETRDTRQRPNPVRIETTIRRHTFSLRLCTSHFTSRFMLHWKLNEIRRRIFSRSSTSHKYYNKEKKNNKKWIQFMVSSSQFILCWCVARCNQATHSSDQEWI